MVQNKKTGSIKEAPKPPFIVAYSGFVNDEVRKKGKEAGFDLVIEAPLTQEKIEVILKILKKSIRKFETSLMNGHKGYNKIPDLSLEESKNDSGSKN